VYDQATADQLTQQPQIPFLDKPPVFAKINTDTVGTGKLRQNGGGNRIRPAETNAFAHRCYLIHQNG
jgi:hypothetical protein